jgi:ABC-type cobalamin transport system permease subunit
VTITTAAPLAAGIITAAAQLSKGSAPKLRIGIAAVAGAVTLNLIGLALPSVARVFAGLIILGVILGPGYDLAAALNRLIK